jgi:hypothetical protein
LRVANIVDTAEGHGERDEVYRGGGIGWFVSLHLRQHGTGRFRGFIGLRLAADRHRMVVGLG